MEGIVLKTIDYKEKSKLVYLYTEIGILSVKVLDVRFKSSFLMTLNVVEFNITKGNLPTLVEYSVLHSFYDMTTNIAKMWAIQPIIEVILNLGPEYPNLRIYPFFKTCLMLMEKAQNPYFVLSLFLIKMLAVFGVKPVLKSCAICGNTKLVNFSVTEGGALCANCAEENTLGKKRLEEFKTIYYLTNYDENLLQLVDYKDLLDTIYQYYLIHVNLKLKNYKI